ncbi:DegT/DnrJ/EryC1/StrS family aminotransferase [Fimbriiglobus ruber]|uniref:Pleiotropic regulatory protein n=1 Tax=Fimbriiglobus ruber TaxID=1908690 RepID=A0A225DNJ2_9BACT|nr:DegT/DnrJ/EryC1/StrS family aminotransferase [Fimbriiglobus ruber]OWK42952.1 Pleiotropic regulatory protein [Fimbriiglobus ruber]
MNIPLKPVAALPLPSDQDATGRTLGDEEIALIAEAVRSGTLTVTKGRFGKTLETDFAALVGAKHAVACSSGSAAIHCAVAAFDPEPGDEIITTSITDMGALTPILYQGAIPVFADVDPRTGNVTAETIAARITDRTKAIVVTHLFGNPCDMTAIMALADAKNIPVIEDCAQAFLATHAGKPVGTFGAIGCFSLQQGKHVTTGEGGLVVANDPALARRVYLFVNKAWGYGDANPDHYFIALNYRFSEIQAACAVAQMAKLPSVVASRVATAARMDELLAGTPGVEIPHREPNDAHTYWKYCLRVDPAVIPGGPTALGKALKEANIASAPRYIQKPAFRCAVFRDQKTFGASRWPFTLARPEAVDYSAERFPGTFDYLDRVLVLPWNEKYTDDHLNYLGASIYQAATRLAQGGAA